MARKTKVELVRSVKARRNEGEPRRRFCVEDASDVKRVRVVSRRVDLKKEDGLMG